MQTDAPSRLCAHLQEMAREIWHNKPVSDEAAFTDDYREHTFRFARIATWAFAIVGTMLMANRLLNVDVTGELGRKNNLDNVVSLLLFWGPPILFLLFRNWAARYYQWVLSFVFAALFIKLGLGVWRGERSIPAAHIAMLTLNFFMVVLLRIPFKHVLVLAVTTNTLIGALLLIQFQSEIPRVLPPLLHAGTIVLIGLYASWRIEARDRTLFDQRRFAERAAQDATNQRERAERSAEDALVAANQRQILHEQLSALYSQRELLIRGLHHDAAHPLYVIGVRTSLMRRRLLDHQISNEELLAELDTITSAKSELGEMLEGMYALVRLGGFVPTYEAISLQDLLTQLEASFRSEAEAKGLTLAVRKPHDAVLLESDRSALKRLIDNLVSNAIKYTLSGTVFVGAVIYRNSVRIDVRDSGVGIAEGDKDRIYKEFERLEQDGVAHVKGLGLGLAIVKLFRDKLAGHYVEHSSRVGLGSRFSVEIPRWTRAVTQALAVNTPCALDPSKVYAAIVEDNESVCGSMRDALSAAGYAVADNIRIAHSVGGLRDIFDRNPYRAPDIVISDYRLKGQETANDVVQLVDERFSWETVPIIVFTAEIQPHVGIERAHVHVVGKSADPTELLNAIQRAIYDARQASGEPLVAASSNSRESGHEVRSG
jgi:two-component system, sensor histidine kinase